MTLERKINDIRNEFLTFCHSIGGKVETGENTVACKLTDRRLISISFNEDKAIIRFLNIHDGEREVRLEFISDIQSAFSPNP